MSERSSLGGRRGGDRGDAHVPSQGVAEAVEPEVGDEAAVTAPAHAAVVDGADGLAQVGHPIGDDIDRGPHGSITVPARFDRTAAGWGFGGSEQREFVCFGRGGVGNM